MGLTFKENCPDIRNTRVVDLVSELEGFNCAVDVYDPWVDKEEAKEEYGVIPIKEPQSGQYDAVILAVGHEIFKEQGVDKLRSYGKLKNIIYDVKYILDSDEVDGRL